MGHGAAHLTPPPGASWDATRPMIDAPSLARGGLPMNTTSSTFVAADPDGPRSYAALAWAVKGQAPA